MGNLAALKTAKTLETDEWQLRVDLAAAFRLAARHDWHEAVANHLSLAVSADGVWASVLTGRVLTRGRLRRKGAAPVTCP